MRIGVDATCWANPRGYGRFARELMRAMIAESPSDEFLCFGDRRAFDAWPLSAPNLTLIEVAQRESPTVAASFDGHRAAMDLLRMTREVSRARPDVFFSPSVYTYFPLPLQQRAVVTVHDTIAERFPALTLPSARARLFWKLKVSLAIRQARLVLTVSEYSARWIAQLLGVPPRRIRVAVEAPSASYTPSTAEDISAAASRAGLPPGARWFAYVGGFNPHKRVDSIIEAHARTARQMQNPPRLLLVGATKGDAFFGELERLRALAASCGTESLVVWTGFVEDAELAHLVSGAVALLLPSESEGFGLPAVEAAACATPVIATVESPLPELLEGGGVFVRPGDVDAIAAAMQSLLADETLRASLGRRARERAATLTWAASAKSAIAAIHEAAA